MLVKEIDGLPVLNATAPISLRVTKGDIAKADPKRPNNCAVAIACRRALHVKEARVHLSRVYLRTNDGNWTRYVTPKSLRTEIIAFDKGGAFAPDAFDLGVPGPSRAATGKRQGSAKKVTKKTPPKTKRRKPHVVTDVRAGPA